MSELTSVAGGRIANFYRGSTPQVAQFQVRDPLVKAIRENAASPGCCTSAPILNTSRYFMRRGGFSLTSSPIPYPGFCAGSACKYLPGNGRRMCRHGGQALAHPPFIKPSATGERTRE